MGAKQSSYKPPPPPSNIPQKNNTSNVSITLDEAYESLEDYKQVINNVYCVSKLLDDYSEEIHDKIGEQGEIYGGLSIKTKPNLINNNGQQNVKPGNTIMYVSSDGLLHISGIMLGNKVLSVKNEDETEHLYWGDDKIC